MERPLQITLRNVVHSDALEAHIREQTLRIERFYPRITGCHVVVEIPHKHRHQGNLFSVRLDVKVPGSEIVVNRELSEDVYVALREVFDAARRKLEDHGRRQRGATKLHTEPQAGTVARIFTDAGYGFIESATGDEYYFGPDNVVTPPFEKIKAGDAVQFIADFSGDAPQAKRVSVGKHHVPA